MIRIQIREKHRLSANLFMHPSMLFLTVNIF